MKIEVKPVVFETHESGRMARSGLMPEFCPRLIITGGTHRRIDFCCYYSFFNRKRCECCRTFLDSAQDYSLASEVECGYAGDCEDGVMLVAGSAMIK